MAVLQIFQDIKDFQEPANLRKVAEEAAKAISFDGDMAEIDPRLLLVFLQIAKGIQYVQTEFGMVADRFYISGERWPNPLNSDEGNEDYVIRYAPDFYAIVVDYTYLGMMCLGMMKNSIYGIAHFECQGKGYCVRAEDCLFLAGVEEAHHACFHKLGGSVEGEYRTREEYRNHPAEVAVAPVLRQAVRYLRIQVYTVEEGRAVPCSLPEETDYQ